MTSRNMYGDKPIGPLPYSPTYAWPGAYPLAYLMEDGGTLCADCMNDPTNPVHMGGIADGWRYEDTYIHYEGAPEICDHCNKQIPSAYGDPNIPESEAN